MNLSDEESKSNFSKIDNKIPFSLSASSSISNSSNLLKPKNYN